MKTRREILTDLAVVGEVALLVWLFVHWKIAANIFLWALGCSVGIAVIFIVAAGLNALHRQIKLQLPMSRIVATVAVVLLAVAASAAVALAK